MSVLMKHPDRVLVEHQQMWNVQQHRVPIKDPVHPPAARTGCSHWSPCWEAKSRDGQHLPGFGALLS